MPEHTYPSLCIGKGKIQPVKSDALVCQMDIMSSLSALLNQSLPDPGTYDSQNQLPAFLGETTKGRDNLIVEAQGKLAIREGNWIMRPPYAGPERNTTGNELGNLPDFTLYNVLADKGQQTNVASIHPAELDKIKADFFELTEGYYKPDVEEVELK